MTTTDNAPVTAQDFLDAMFPVSTSKERFEKLLSRACYNAFIFGRKQGLKEMDEARNYLQHEMAEKGPLSKYGQRTAQNTVDTLRQEYSAK